MSLLEAEPTRARATLYGGLVAAVLLPLAAFGMYRWLGSPQSMSAPASPSSGTSMATPDHGTDMQAAIAKLAEKLRRHPDDAEGWALLGRTYKATQHYAEAQDAFRHALEAEPGDKDLEREYAAAGTPADAGQAAEGAAHIVVNVALDPKFKDSVAPNDTLFVFAKAEHGPPMPLAIARLTAAQLPARVTLTDAMGMVPSVRLSQFPQIIVGARISKSGHAMAESGDLETLPASTTAQAEPVHLVIAERVD